MKRQQLTALLTGLALIAGRPVLAAMDTSTANTAATSGPTPAATNPPSALAAVIHIPGMTVQAPTATMPIQMAPPGAVMPMLPVSSKTMQVPPPAPGAHMPMLMPAQ